MRVKSVYPQSIVQPVGSTDCQVSEGTDISGQSGEKGWTLLIWMKGGWPCQEAEGDFRKLRAELIRGTGQGNEPQRGDGSDR